MHRLASAAFAVVLSVPALAAPDPREASVTYQQLQKWTYSSPASLTAPVTIRRDTATWTFESGSVRLMEPAPDGTSTGLLFEGQGRFQMTIPDRYEVAQLQRYTRSKALQSLDLAFTQLVLRTSNAAVAGLFPPAIAPYAAHPIATKRHEAWLIDAFEDADATVLTSMLNAGAEYFLADMKTAEHDWLLYEYDSASAEEITLAQISARGVEVWVSLDRAEDRNAEGRPGGMTARAVLEHIDVQADLTRHGRSGAVGSNQQRTLQGRYVVEATFTGGGAPTNALLLTLTPTARNVKAYGPDRTELTLLRDAIGKRSINVDNKLHDDDLVVILPAPLLPGEKQKVRFDYELETANYAPGRSWYPTIPDSFEQKHTARLELIVRKRNELRSMGRMEKKTEAGDVETSIWIVDRPTKMVTFSTATRFEEVKVAVDGIPPILSFGPDFQFTNTAKLRNVAADVANSVQYFQQVLGSKLPSEQIYVTSIAAGHGQAFDGFLHMTEYTFEAEHPGASELFRAHEVAHQWFGHKVGWKTYRDQWLSEAFAEYAAMMFVSDVVKGGDKYLDEILRSYDGITKGNFSGGFSKFNRPSLIERNSQLRERMGPIGHGWRASTTEIPAGYFIQTYHKGPLVVHMLRMLLGLRTGNDDVFFKTLRDYLDEYDGKAASTEDFRRVLERNSGGTDFGWFFDAWIYRAEIPSYTWDYSVTPDGDGFLISFDLERRDVSDDFTAVIPVRVEMEGGKMGYLFLPSRTSKETVVRRLPAKPKKVTFAPDFSLLASVKRK